MNRRTILAILTGSATGLYSRFTWAGNGSSAVAGLLSQSENAGGADEKAVRRTSKFPDLKATGVENQVRSITYSRGAYCVTTADGTASYFLEADLRFKIDSSDLGPQKAVPVMLPAGIEGDRAWIFFSSPEEITGFIKTGHS